MQHKYHLLLFDVHHCIMPCFPSGFDTIEAAKGAAKEHADMSYRIGCWQQGQAFACITSRETRLPVLYLVARGFDPLVWEKPTNK